MKPTQYIILYDDGDCLCLPMQWDDDCKGAVCSFSHPGPVAVFPSRVAAKQAIKISRAFAMLEKAQGRTHNEDFISELKNIKIVPLKP